jgi:acyltransferase
VPTAAPSVPERLLGLDLARVIGVGAIVAGHTWSGRPVDVWLFSWHVPLFFLLSGYLWRAGRPLGLEVRRRARTLLVPYAGWYVIVATIWFAYLSRTDDEFQWSSAAATLLGGTHAPRPFSAFWFITALFVACVLLRALERYPRYVSWLVVAAGLGLCQLDRFAVSDIWWSAGTAVPSMVFLLIGIELRHHRAAIGRPGLTGAVLLVAGLLPFVTDRVATLNMKPGNFGTPYLGVLCSSAIVIGLVLVCEAVAARVPRAVLRPVEPLALSALVVVLSHALVLGLVERGAIEVESLWAVYALALVPPWVLGLVLLRTPLRRVLV